MSVSLSELSIDKFAVYELKEGSTLPCVGRETAVYDSSHRLLGRVHLYVFKDEASVNGGIVKAP